MASRLLKFKSERFDFSGSLDDSKSIVNRLLIVQSYFPSAEVHFHSQAEDVVYLRQALQNLEENKTNFDLGAGGTSLRFFLARLSRRPGAYVVRAHPALLKRPHEDLYKTLEQLGTTITPLDDQRIKVHVQGWQGVREVRVKSDVSSQFASAIILNSWDLHHSLTVFLEGELASASFLELTERVCRNAGMQLHEHPRQRVIESGQKLSMPRLKSEVDASSVFTLACFALLYGKLKINPLVNQLGQPDFAFLDFFRSEGIEFTLHNEEFSLSKQTHVRPVQIDIKNCPDLFPVLCAWLSFCPGEHKIFGAPHLVSKESNRILKTYELLTLAGIAAWPLSDGMIVHGQACPQKKSFVFDPAHDHRMAFAAAVFAFGGFRVTLTDIDVVKKSFPQFWTILGLQHD
ncbi:MAG: hypothetical protein JNL11_04765 [Bdellovibrionaceae bacterium]|nr:hypothetical protein [Pseudobdellovibrionaceae bacterium]